MDMIQNMVRIRNVKFQKNLVGLILSTMPAMLNTLSSCFIGAHSYLQETILVSRQSSDSVLLFHKLFIGLEIIVNEW